MFLLESEGRLRVVTAPPGSPRPRQVFALAPGQWARWRFNGRFTPDGCACRSHLWWYEKWVVNVAYGLAPAPALFTASTPARVAGELVRLL